MKTATPDKPKNRLPQNADGTKTGSLVPVNPDDAAESKDAADQLHEFTPVTDFFVWDYATRFNSSRASR